MKIPYSIFLIDFRNFRDFNEFKNFVIKNRMSWDSVDSWWKVHTGEWCGYRIDKIWIDPITNALIGYELGGERRFSDDFLNYIQTIKPIDLKSEPIRDQISKYQRENPGLSKDNQNSNQVVGEMTIDSILDKINLSGINSLTKIEKEFLDSSS
jgi:hypothetical protein